MSAAERVAGVVQLPLNFELRDRWGCRTFGDLPSFSLEEGVWKQEKKKKKKIEREEGRGTLLCSAVICGLAKL